MEWIVIEGVDDAGARLTALRLSDGATRLLFATEQPAPLHASLHPQVTRVAIDAVSRGAAGGRSRSRVGIVNLERPGVGSIPSGASATPSSTTPARAWRWRGPGTGCPSATSTCTR